MITDEIVFDQITVLLDGQIQVRRNHRFLEDGVLVAEQYHRHVVEPGNDLSGEDSRVTLIAAVVHTPAVIADYRAAEARLNANNEEA